MADHEMTEPEPSAHVLVILPAQDIRLPEILRHIEAGRTVLLIPAPKPADQGDPTPGINAQEQSIQAQPTAP
jgi:hypothetical protein